MSGLRSRMRRFLQKPGSASLGRYEELLPDIAGREEALHGLGGVGNLQQLSRSQIVLRRQNLSRRHQGGLVTIFDRDQCCLNRDDFLAGADVAL